MKATIAIWVLSGALLASASLNVYHAGRICPARRAVSGLDRYDRG